MARIGTSSAFVAALQSTINNPLTIYQDNVWVVSTGMFRDRLAVWRNKVEVYKHLRFSYEMILRNDVMYDFYGYITWWQKSSENLFVIFLFIIGITATFYIKHMTELQDKEHYKTHHLLHTKKKTCSRLHMSKNKNLTPRVVYQRCLCIVCIVMLLSYLCNFWSLGSVELYRARAFITKVHVTECMLKTLPMHCSFYHPQAHTYKR